MAARKAPVARSLAPVSLQQRAAVALGRAVSAQVHRLEQALKPFELTPTQYNVLRILNRARGGLCSAEIGDRLISQGPDVTRLLDRMGEAGLVERERDPHNRRVVTTRITDAGLEKLHETTPIVDAALREHYRGFTRAQLNALLEAFPDPYGTD